MNEPRQGPTPEDIEEYGQVDDTWEDVDVQFNTEVSYARVELTYEQTCTLVEAGQLVGENPIAFMRNAALARATAVLTADEGQAEPAAAGD